MRKILCVLCAMVIALLPVMVLAAEAEDWHWEQFDCGVKDLVMGYSPEMWCQEENASLLYVIMIYEVHINRNEIADLTFYGNGAFVGRNDKMVYIVGKYSDKETAVIQFDAELGTCSYVLIEVTGHEENEGICQELCGLDYLQLDPESLGPVLNQLFG